jgi:hypothetical protein
LLAHRQMVPGPVLGNRSVGCQGVGRVGLLAADCDDDEVQAEQQGGDGPVKIWWVESSQRMG